MGGEKTSQEFEVNPDHVDWLKEMADKFGLPDESKTLRVLLDYAMDDGNLDEIFSNVRCKRC